MKKAGRIQREPDTGTNPATAALGAPMISATKQQRQQGKPQPADYGQNAQAIKGMEGTMQTAANKTRCFIVAAAKLLGSSNQFI